MAITGIRGPVTGQPPVPLPRRAGWRLVKLALLRGRIPVQGAPRIVTASKDKTARIWDLFLGMQALVSAAKSAVPRCLTPAERKAFFLSPEPPAWCVEMK